jgi:hypothetical protein
MFSVTFGSNDQGTLFLMSTQVQNQVQKFPKIKNEVSYRILWHVIFILYTIPPPSPTPAPGPED